ncbi:hypothetical protein ACFVT2_17205 [Streptomyces sp. NPDC058000]|uniref:allene oxide cyclase barrel-like domain-containing protein n=1 Tax=Streptomyces sp. NPDC058000 TaxID=3346299 RepID=UPI0036ED6914
MSDTAETTQATATGPTSDGEGRADALLSSMAGAFLDGIDDLGAVSPAAVPDPSAPLGELDSAGQVTLDHLTEYVRGGHGLITPVPELGQVRYYHDELHTASGDQIGTVAGRLEIIHRRPSDGHMFAVRTEQVRLLGHTFRFTGLNDITAEFAGAWVSVPGVGLTGDHLGRSALRAIHMTPTPRVSDVRIVMCR